MKRAVPSKKSGPMAKTPLPSSQRSEQQTIGLTVIYELRVSLDKAEAIVGRPWVKLDDEDDGWEIDLQEAVGRALPVLPNQAESPIVEWT